MEGTLGGGYEFVEAPDVDDYVSVTPDELMINRKLLHKDLQAKLEKADFLRNRRIDNDR
ncbi:hypothetical protein [Ruminococcus champanellensis]|nr:hypothetical protein [Ruminococcus champanellensis]